MDANIGDYGLPQLHLVSGFETDLKINL